jgi:hypothetical protein
MRENLLGQRDNFTLRESVDVFEASCSEDRIEDTTEYLGFNSCFTGWWPNRLLTVELGRCLGWELKSDESPSIISASIEIPVGLASHCVNTFILAFDQYEKLPSREVCARLRKSLLFKSYADATPKDSRLTLWGDDDFSELADGLMDVLTGAGVLDECDSNTRHQLDKFFSPKSK